MQVLGLGGCEWSPADVRGQRAVSAIPSGPRVDLGQLARLTQLSDHASQRMSPPELAGPQGRNEQELRLRVGSEEERDPFQSVGIAPLDVVKDDQYGSVGG